MTASSATVTSARPVRLSRFTLQSGGTVTAAWRCTTTGDGWKDGATAVPTAATSGSTTCDGAEGPRWTPLVAACGVGQTLGQSALATETRRRWPARKTQPVVSSSTSSTARSPGGSSAGSVSESRRVTLSMPFATSCDVPSGSDVAEAHAEADHARRGVDVQLRRRAAEHVHVLVQPRRGVDQRERLVGPLVAGQPEVQAARPELAGHADRRVVAELVGTAAPICGPSRPSSRRYMTRSPAPAIGQAARRAIRPPTRADRRRAARPPA